MGAGTLVIRLVSVPSILSSTYMGICAPYCSFFSGSALKGIASLLLNNTRFTSRCVGVLVVLEIITDRPSCGRCGMCIHLYDYVLGAYRPLFTQTIRFVSLTPARLTPALFFRAFRSLRRSAWALVAGHREASMLFAIACYAHAVLRDAG